MLSLTLEVKFLILVKMFTETESQFNYEIVIRKTKNISNLCFLLCFQVLQLDVALVLTLVTADSSCAASSIEVVLLVQYANISLVEREM